MKETMQAGHTHVIHPRRVDPHGAQRLDGLLGDAHIARPRRNDGYLSDVTRRHGRDLDAADARERRVAQPLNLPREGLRLRLIEPRHQDVLPSASDLGRDRRDLFDALPLAEDHLGDALAKRAVVVDRRHADVSERQASQRLESVVYEEIACLHPLEQLTDMARIHSMPA